MSLLQELLDHEINASISTFWDGVVEAKLGDDLNGFSEQATFGTVAEAETWLVEAACRHYPNSSYARARAARSSDVAQLCSRRQLLR